MISSVRNESYYQYQNVGSYSAKDASNAFQVDSSTTTEGCDKMPPPPPEPASSETLSSAEHMEMMCGGKPIPEISETSSATVDEETLSEYDVDGDGVLSAEEYSAMMEAKRLGQISSESGSTGGIASFDADSDGTISADEYEEMISELGISNALTADEFFAQYDVNGDGEISQDEMPAPGTVGAPAEEVTGQYGEEEDEEIMFAEYQKLLFKALQAYGNHYESMFDTVEGTLKRNQA